MSVGEGSASVHVVTTSLGRPWRAATAARRASRWLRTSGGAPFFVCGRTSFGNGRRDISRSLSPNRIVVVADWADPEAADRGRAAFDAWARDGRDEVWSAALVPVRAHGAWHGRTPFRPSPAASGGTEAAGPSASLTCARIRPRRMGAFYLRSFPGLARAARRSDSAMIAGLGFGGPVPLREALTVSFWPSSADVDAFAFRGSSHDGVQRRSSAEGWLSERLFARFVVVDHDGAWAGEDPLAGR